MTNPGLLLTLAMLSTYLAAQSPSLSPSKTETKKKSPLFNAVPSVGGDLPENVDVSRGKEAGEPKKGEFLAAPIPMINPTLENGLGFVGGYLYPTDGTAPPSMTGGGVFRTSNGSWGFGMMQKLHLKGDLFRITAAAGYMNLNYKFFGIGANAGNSGKYVPITQVGRAIVGEALIRLHGKWYMGPRYMIMKSSVGINRAELSSGGGEPPPESPTVPVADIRLQTASLGPHLQRDTRDDEMYPHGGSLFNTQIGFNGKAIGGNRNYQSYQFSFSKYMSLSSSRVFAFRGSSCFTSGSAPFYDLCGFQSKDVRGYAAGRYLDRDMIAGQAEFRQELPYRLGLVLFAGAGGVAPEPSAFKFTELRPGAGAGVRFRLTKKNHINLSADYARGIGSSAFYVTVGEVF